jgi:UDP-3-O-[3-hydroxymyristoyl] glucosamine N-acyltransferase
MGDGARFTLRALAEALGAGLEGDPDVVVSGVAPLEHAGPEHVSFLTDGRYLAAARSSRAGAFLAGPEAHGLPATVLRVAAPRLALVALLRLFEEARPAPAGIHPAAVIANGAFVDLAASVGAYAVIEEGAIVRARARVMPFAYVGHAAEIGEDSTLHPHAVVLERVRLGRRVIVHAGAVLGADGFGFVPHGGGWLKLPQIGGVVIEDDVEIGANTTIDRSTMGDTLVRRGTKIDNLVQIAHNVEVGADSVIAAQAGIAGSTRLGRHVVVGGQVGIADHLAIADEVVLAAQTGVIADVPAPGHYLGTPSRPLLEAKRIWVLESRLPELVRRVRKLERRLAALERPGEGAGESASR